MNDKYVGTIILWLVFFFFVCKINAQFALSDCDDGQTLVKVQQKMSINMQHTLFDSFFIYCFISIGNMWKQNPNSNANIFHSTTQHCSCLFLCTARHCFDAVSLCAKLLHFIFFSLFFCVSIWCFCIVYFAFGNPCYLVLPGLFPPCMCVALASINIRFKDRRSAAGYS